MTDLSDRASRYNLSASADWQAVLTSFELGTGFQFIVLLVIDEDGAEACRTALTRRLDTAGKRLLEIRTGSRDELENIADPLLHTSPPPDTGAVWVSRVVHEADPEFAAWRKSWTKAVAHLNQYRNPFRRAWKVPVIFVGAPWLQVVLRENAPDLWSVRTTVAVVEPVPQAALVEPSRMMTTPPAGRGPDPEMALAEVEKLRASGAPELATARMLYRAGLGFASRYQWQEARRAFAECLEIRLRAGAGPEDLADVHFELGRALAWLADYGKSQSAFEQALGLYRRLANVAGEARCLFGLGEVALWCSDYNEAGQRFEAALLLFREVGDVSGEADCIERRGDIALRRSDHAVARECYEAALVLTRRVGDVLGEANCIESLGAIALARSDRAGAQQHLEDALALYRKVGNELGEANCILRLGILALERSNHDEARARLEAARAMYRNLGDVLGEANCIKGLADIAREPSDYADARYHYETALPLYRRVGDVLGEANCIRSLGDVALNSSDHAAARQHYEAALILFGQVSDVRGEANCLWSLGNAALWESDYAEAQRRYDSALPLFRRIGDVLGEASCILRLGDLALARSENDAARRTYEQALSLYELIEDPYTVGYTYRRLARLADDPAVRARHIQAAREAWLSIDRPDLIKQLEDEFGAPAEPASANGS